MKHFALFIVIATLTTACQKAPQTTEETTPETTETFINVNVPTKGLDVNEYAFGVQHIGLPTADVQGTIDFYLGLGFKLATRHDINGRDFAFVQLGSLMLEIIPNDSPALQNGAVDHFCIDVKRIDELFAKLKEAGYTMLDEHVNDIAFWQDGARYFFIEGPNKERIEFCEVL